MAIASSTRVLRVLVRIAIFTDMAPMWANAAAASEAARKGINMGFLSG